MARKVVFTSGMNRVGQSTICALVGCGLASLGKKVVLVDLSMGSTSLHSILNVDIKFDIFDVAKKYCRLRQAIVGVPDFLQLYCLPCAKNSGKVGTDFIYDVFENLKENFDFVLIDCPIYMSLNCYKTIFNNSETIIISTLDKKSVLSANNVASLICGWNASIKLFVNNISMLEKKRRQDKLVADWLKLDLFDSMVHMHKDIRWGNEFIIENGVKFAQELIGSYYFNGKKGKNE